MYVSSLLSSINDVAAELEVVADSAEGEVDITNFSDVGGDGELS